MKYKYLPNSYNDNLIIEKFENYDEFVNMQILYRTIFEKYLLKYVNFKDFDAKIDIPIIDDQFYNFYHKYSILGSNYIFVRNNYHVENLTNEELQELRNMNDCDVEFLKKTLSKVMFEEGDYVFYGSPIRSNEVESNKIVIEFAYDQTKIKTIEELKKIEKTIVEIRKEIEDKLTILFDSKPAFLVYNGIPDYYRNHENSLYK